MEHFYDLFDNKIGTLLDSTDWDENNCCLMLNGVEMVCIDNIEHDIDKLVETKGAKIELWQDDAYRGVGCYSGFITIGTKVYTIDIMNEYVGYECVPVTK